MVATLPQLIGKNNINPSISKEFFSYPEVAKIDKISALRECPEDGRYPPKCSVNLAFGFFFDGTNNNLQRDYVTHNYSNVARLYLAFPGREGLKQAPIFSKIYPHYFRTYVPGVGTEFLPVADTGEGKMKKDGLAFAKLGQNRIIWALVDAINHVHRYYLDTFLVSDDVFLKEFNVLDLPSFGVTKLSSPGKDLKKLTDAFTRTLGELHTKLSVFLPVGEGKQTGKGVVEHIYYSVFGFSRGATEARVFANWFLWLCQLDAKLAKRPGPTLGTIPLTFDFMGLFDTVASVGLASSAPLIGAHGHYGWADAEHSLKLPEIAPAQCVHLVSAHEIRRSFPLDSILDKNNSRADCREIVMPGVHSDIGGGYLPKEQGRGSDEQGEDLLSRIPLSVMYREARLAGVPLKLEEASDEVKMAFRISPKLIERFNAFVEACAKLDQKQDGKQDNAPLAAPLHEIMARQHQLYILWRKKMVGNMKALQSVIDSDSCDREDILAADRELANEIKLFEEWREWKNSMKTDGGPPPFSYQEWSTIETYWNQPAPPAAITDLFDHHVHDSRAWFKPFGKDAGELLVEMEKLAMREEQILAWKKNPVGPAPAPLTRAEFERVTRYLPYRNTADACVAAGFVSKGREGNFLHGGFLRYRKVYMGSDSFKPKGAVYVKVESTADDHHIAEAANANEIVGQNQYAKVPREQEGASV